jgi:hypothetical protein
VLEAVKELSLARRLMLFKKILAKECCRGGVCTSAEKNVAKRAVAALSATSPSASSKKPSKTWEKFKKMVNFLAARKFMKYPG